MSLALYFTFLQGDHSMLWYIQIKNIHFLKDLMHIWHPFKCFLLLSVSSQVSSWPSFPPLAPQMQAFPEFNPQSFSLPICSFWECVRIVLLKNGVKEVLARPSI